MKEINFVAARSKRLTETQKTDQKLLRISLAVLVVSFVLFLAGLGLRFYFVYQVNDVQSQQASARSAIASQEEIEKEYNIFAHKLKQLSLLFEKRKNKQEAIEYFSSLFASDVELTNIDYNASQNDVLTFVITAPDIFSFDQVYALLNSSEVLDPYPSIDKSSLKRNDEGEYSIQLTVYLGGRQEK